MNLKAAFLKRLDTCVGHLAAPLTRVATETFAATSAWAISDHPKKPLLVRPGGMGDLICLHIALEACGLSPKEFTFLIEQRSSPWADLHQLDYRSYDQELLYTLRSEWATYSSVLCTEQRFGLALAFAQACLRTGGRLMAFDTCRGVWGSGAVKIPYDPINTHEVLSFITMLQAALGQRSIVSGLEERNRRFPSSGHLVACLAGSNQPSRDFSPKAWVLFLDAWAGSRTVYLTCSTKDLGTAREIVRLRSGPTNLVHAAFSRVIELLSRAESVLSVDGGMVHAASFFGVPTTAIFTSGSVNKWKPLAKGSCVVAMNGLSCRPCTRFGQVPPCPNGLACMAIPETWFIESTSIGPTSPCCDGPRP